MSLVINTNVASLQAQANLGMNQQALAVSYNRLSSGLRINSASDDAAGLAISTNFQAQIRSMAVAGRNANDGISMAQTADGALGQVSGLLTRMRELSVQAANGSQSSADRGYMNTEFSQLQSEISRIQQSTKYDGNQLIAGTSTNTTFQVGINNNSNDQISVKFGAVSLTSVLSTGTKLSGAGATAALAAISTIDTALANVSTSRANFGAVMNRLNVTISNLQTTSTNLSAANSRIVDVDVAQESSQLSRTTVLAQAGASVLAQANQAPQLALGLLRG
jgi:flagellin